MMFVPVELLLLEAKKLPVGTLRKYGPHWYIKVSEAQGKKGWTYYAADGTARGQAADATSQAQAKAAAEGGEYPLPADIDDFVPKPAVPPAPEASKPPAAPETPAEPVAVATPPTAPAAPTPTPEPAPEPAPAPAPESPSGPPEEPPVEILPAEPAIDLPPGTMPPKVSAPHGQKDVSNHMAKLPPDAARKAAAYVGAVLGTPVGGFRVGGKRPAKKKSVEKMLHTSSGSDLSKYKGAFKALFGDALPGDWREKVAEAWEAATDAAIHERAGRCADAHRTIAKLLGAAMPGKATNSEELQQKLAAGEFDAHAGALVTALGPEWKQQVSQACSTLDEDDLKEILIPAVWTKDHPRPADTRPPVSNGLKLQPAGSGVDDHAPQIQTGIDAIDSLHGDGQLPPLPVHQKQPEGGALGCYNQSPDNKGTDIRISPHGHHQELTTVHEIGHFLDNQGLTRAFGTHGVYGSTVFSHHVELPEMRDLWGAITSSAAMKNLVGELAHQKDKAHPDAAIKGFCEYLLRRSEIFARAYSQWVAVKTQNATMLHQAKKRSMGGGNKLGQQWDPEDFQPIDAAFTKLFQRLGWMHHE